MVVPAPPRPPTIHCFLGPEATLQILMEHVQLFSQVSGGGAWGLVGSVFLLHGGT